MKVPFVRTLLLAAASIPLAVSPSLRAADHADSPTVAGDQAADLADAYLFVDPNDSTKIVIINTLRGFIVPGEAGNFAIFDSTIRYRFQIENTGDATPDAFIDVKFVEKTTSAGQKAKVAFSGAFTGLKGKFTGRATPAGLGATPPGGAEYFPLDAQNLKDADGDDSNIEFFAGETDDPFFFDIPGFVRFRDSVLAGTPNTSHLSRGRDTFAGYNVMTIAFRLPISALKNPRNSNATKFGLNVLAQRGTERTFKGAKIRTGAFNTVDREGIPAVNALLVPLARKNAYNGATTQQDANGKFAPDIVGTLQALGTHPDNIDVLAGVAVASGDILRIDTTSGLGFPTGRKPADDVVDTLLTIITNANRQEPPATVGDSVPSNDVAFETRFPYLGLPHQPRDPGAGAEDNTRN